jgi:hypothetical protein
MILARFIKRPDERKRYALVYSEWLDTGETIINAAFAVTPATAPILEIDAFSISALGTEVVFFANFGASGTNYTVDVSITTSGGQIKKDQVLFSVKGH